MKYPNPLNGVPAGTELLICLCRADVETGNGGTVGEKGVENGWAADVDVAAGGSSWV